MTRLSLVGAGSDRELDAIRGVIESFESVGGLDDVMAVLHQHYRRGSRAEILDAIGHSRSEGFLVLGTWVVDDSSQTAATFSELLRPLLSQLGVRTIRLLGCSTATTERGRNAIRRIAHVTGCDVLGTRRYLNKYDYGRTGFVSDDMLVEVDGAHRRPTLPRGCTSL
jgi:hypothetical protein